MPWFGSKTRAEKAQDSVDGFELKSGRSASSAQGNNDSHYVSPLAPHLTSKDKAAFQTTRLFRLFDDDVDDVPKSSAREVGANWSPVNPLFQAKSISTQSDADVKEEDRQTVSFDYKKIAYLFLPDKWFIFGITAISMTSNVMNLFLPSFNGQYINSLICEQAFTTVYTLYLNNPRTSDLVRYFPWLPLTPPLAVRDDVGNALAGNISVCNRLHTLTMTLAGNCCSPGLEETPYFSIQTAGDDFHGFQRSLFFLKLQIYASVLATVFSFTSSILSFLFQFRFLGRMRKTLIESFLNQEIAFFDIRPAGSLTSRVMNDCAQIIGLSNVISAVTNTVVTLCFTASKAYGYSLPLLVFYLSFVPIEGMIIYLSGRFNRKWTFAVNKLTAEQSQIMKEILDNVKLARVFNGVSAAMSQFTNILQRRYRQDAYIQYVRQFGFGLSLQLVSSVFGLSLMIIASRMISGFGQFPPFTGSITYGSYSAFKQYADTLKSSLSSLTSLYATIITICTVAQTLCVFIYRKPKGGSETAQGPGIVVEGKDSLDCTIRFQDVKFSYPSRPKIPVLKGFTVTFPPKKFTCVIGNSGSGKSTLLMLILRMYAYCIAICIYMHLFKINSGTNLPLAMFTSVNASFRCTT